MIWQRFLRCWPFVKGINRKPMDSLHKGPVFLSCKPKQMFENKAHEPWVIWDAMTPIMMALLCDVSKRPRRILVIHLRVLIKTRYQLCMVIKCLLSRRIVSVTSSVSVLRNKIKCIYIRMFPEWNTVLASASQSKATICIHTVSADTAIIIHYTCLD